MNVFINKVYCGIKEKYWNYVYYKIPLYLKYANTNVYQTFNRACYLWRV